MKKIYLFAALVAVAVAGCQKLDGLGDISRDFSYSETVDVPSVPGLPAGIDTLPQGGLTAYAPTVATGTNSKEYITQSGTSENLVKHVKITKFSASIPTPAGANFDFMDSIMVYISAKGLDKKLVAHKYGIPKGQQKVDLDCEDINLKEYFVQDSMYVDFGGHFVGIPDSATKVELSSTFNMLANVLQDK